MKKIFHFITFFSFLFFVTGSLLSQVYVELEHHQPTELKLAEFVDININLGESTPIGGIEIISGGTAPYTYLWEPSQGLDHNNIPNPIASPEETTTYTLTVVDDLECELIAHQTVTVNQTSSAIGTISDSYFRIFPNPGYGEFSIEGRNLQPSARLVIRIYNLVGQQIYEEEVRLSSNSFTKRVDLIGQPGGSYIAKVQYNQRLYLQLITNQ
jgi:hypothetical protein